MGLSQWGAGLFITRYAKQNTILMTKILPNQNCVQLKD